MHRKTLREIAKFTSGLIAGDFLVGLWVYFSGLAPLSFFGIYFTPKLIIFWMIFDAILFVFLVHYGWRMEERERTDGEKAFHKFAGTIFAIVALLHLSRILFGWQFVIGSWSFPYWLNGLGTIVAGFLAYFSFHLAIKR